MQVMCNGGNHVKSARFWARVARLFLPRIALPRRTTRNLALCSGWVREAERTGELRSPGRPGAAIPT